MTQSKTAHCSVCNQPIKTAQGAISMKQVPLVCRRCFGEQSYDGLDRWNVISGSEHPTGAAG